MLHLCPEPALIPPSHSGESEGGQEKSSEEEVRGGGSVLGRAGEGVGERRPGARGAKQSHLCCASLQTCAQVPDDRFLK